MSLSSRMKELETIVRRLKAAKVKLDEAVAAYERGRVEGAHLRSKNSRKAH